MTFISDLIINNTALRIKTGEKLNKLWGDIGDKSQLLTSNRTSLVNAINELYTNSDGFVKKIGDTMTGSLIFSNTHGIVINNGPSYSLGIRDMGDINSSWARTMHSVRLKESIIDTMGHFGTATQLTFGYIGGTNYNVKSAIRWSPDGNVGIGLTGTNSPQEVLDVNGSIRMVRNGGSALSARDKGGIYIDTPTDTSTAEMIVRHRWSATNLTFGVGGTSNPSAGSMNSWGLYRWKNDRTANGTDGFIGWYGDDDNIRISALTGTGNRLVIAAANGNILTQTLPDFDGFVKKVGDTMSGILNFSTATAMVANSDVTFLAKGQQGTILANSALGSSNSIGVVIRPTGYTTAANQTIFSGDGFIRSYLHGDSSQWKQAYDWGDHSTKQYWNFDSITPRAVSLNSGTDADTYFDARNGGYVASYGGVGWLANGAFSGYGGLIHYRGTSANMALQIHYENGHNTTDGGRVAFRTKHNSGYTTWKEFYHTGNLPNQLQTLSISNSVGSISISNGNNVRLDSLAGRDYLDATVRLKETGLIPYRTLAGNTGYPSATIGGGIRWERVSTTTNQTGFYIHKTSGQDLLWYKTFDGENTENSWKMIADRDWVAAQGYDNAYALLPSSASTIIGKYYAQKGSVNVDDVKGNIAFYTQNNTVGSLDYCHHLSFGTNTTFNWQLRKAPTNGGGFGIRTRNSTGWTPWENIAYEAFIINQLQNYYTKTESLDLFVGVSNVQTIGGTKTFSNSPIVPTATLNSHAINKGQIESWVNSQGFSIQTLTAGTNIQISTNNVISATNTTYSAGTLALLNAGTDTSNRVWKTKDIADYVVAKLAQGADSIWEHTPQGGLRIRNYDSLATRDGAIAITKGGGATKINAIGIGTSVNSDGNDGIVVGPLSVNLGTYGTVVGPYSVNTAMEGVVTGPFLQNNQRGCTVTGRYNHPIQNATTNTINNYSPLFIIGNGKSASIRSNAYEMFSDGKGEFANVQSYKNQHSFGDMDIPNWKFIQDNIGGGDGNGSEDWVSNYGSQISVFEEQKANEQLGSSPYGGTGEILADQKFSNVDKPTLVYLGNDGIWRKWNNSANAEQGNLSNSAVLGIALGDMKSVLLRGYYVAKLSVELQDLVIEVNNGNMFHSINKGTLMAGSSTSFTERVFGYSINSEVAYFNPWMFKR